MLKNRLLLVFFGLLWCGLVCTNVTLAQDAAKDTTKQTQATDQGGGGTPAAGGLSADAAVVDQGKALFDGNCKQCHAINEQVVGPALKGITERRTLPWLVNFIKYPQKTIESGDPYAKALYDKYKQFMPNHDFLKDEEVNAILSYVVNGKHDVAQTTTTATTEGGGGEAKSQNSGILMGVIAGLVILLVLVLAVLTLLASVLSRYLAKEKQLDEIDQELVSQQFSLGKFVRSQAFLGTVTFIFVALVAKSVTDGALAIGVQQGYAPEQPIPFSHKLHAGAYEIDCKYCHTTVEKSKQASIPSANICMNCHNSIKTTSPNMQKIYAAIENDEPIQWVRVHNLPDLAYFNHAQHVKVGGLDCTNCHGDVKNMEVIQQQSILTMGWCIDCHRKTDVNAKGNAYYDKLLELHGTSSKKPLKVEDIGGLECGKCHY